MNRPKPHPIHRQYTAEWINSLIKEYFRKDDIEESEEI